MNFAIYGASGCGRGVMPIARAQCKKNNLDTNLVFIDDNFTQASINGHNVFSFDEWLATPVAQRTICIAIANPKIRESIALRCNDYGIGFFEVRANNVVQLDQVSIQEGAILCPFVTLTSNIIIGRHFHANLYSYVEHDCIIGDFVTFAPGVKCNGNVHIEDRVYVGSGAIIKQGTSNNPLVIGKGAVIGMGAVVTKSIPAGSVVIGNPARPISQ